MHFIPVESLPSSNKIHTPINIIISLNLLHGHAQIEKATKTGQSGQAAEPIAIALAMAAETTVSRCSHHEHMHKYKHEANPTYI